MEIVFRTGSAEREVTVAADPRTATVGELARALGAPTGADGGLVVDGVLAAAELVLLDAGVHPGVVVRPPPRRRRRAGASVPTPALTLDVTGGLVAGPSWPLPVGTTSVGRGLDNDVVVDHPTVSARHCTITVDAALRASVSDLDSHNGTWLGSEDVTTTRVVPLGATLRIGAVHLAVRSREEEAAADARRRRPDGPGGTVAVNRPPRPAPPPELAPLATPRARPPASPPAPLSVVALVAPVVFAGAMVAVLGRPVYGLFALLGPVMALGTWVEGGRRSRRTARRDDRELAAELERFGTALAEGVARRAAAQRAGVPDPARARRRAEGAGPQLWERRPGHHDFLVVHAGIGDLPWDPPLSEDGGARPVEVDQLLATTVLPEVPVSLDLAAGGVVGVVGDRAPALALARSLLCQAATHSGPADLAVAVLTDADRVGDWDWSKWLPHTRAAWRPDARLLAGEPEATAGLVRALLAAGDASLTLVVVDSELLTEGRRAPARALLRGEGGSVAGIVVAASEQRLPASCTAIVHLGGPEGEARLRHLSDGDRAVRFHAAGVTEPVARDWARRLARFEDSDAAAPAPVVPEAVSLASLLDVDAFDPAAILAGWRRGGRRRPAGVPVGVSEEGPVCVDLFESENHLLVTGGTGSGKTELLHGVVAGLAVQHHPERVNVVLVSPDGGPCHDLCARLPHTVGVAAGTGGRAERALRHVDDEVRRRRRDGVTVPRLVVVVDELGAFDADAATVLAGIARRGPSAGVHLLVASEGEAPVPAGDLGAGTLTVTLGPRPGRGVARVGQSEGVALQAVGVSGTTTDSRAAPAVAPFRFGPTPASPAGGTPCGPSAGGAGSDLARLVEAVGGAVEAAESAPPPPLWSGDAVAEAAAPTVGLPELLGLADMGSIEPAVTWRPRPARDLLRVPIGVTPSGEPLQLDLKEPALAGMGPHGLVVGATGSGKSELLRTVVTGLAVTHHPDHLGFVLVDFKGGATFAGLAGLPHVAGMITNLQHDLGLVDRVRAALFGEQRRRQELLRAAGNVASLQEYQARRAAGADLEPLPSLLIVVDEFAELLDSRPDFIDLFVAVGRLGRSLGMHLLLASQRLDEGRLRGLESHLSYRIGLRTFSATDARAVLGGVEAFHLPPEPGGGYLKVHTTVFERFRAALVSDVDVAVDRLRDAAPPSHQVWLPPLPPLVTLDQLVTGLGEDPSRGLVAEDWPGVGRLVVPLGVLDRPDQQAQFVLVADLAGAGGNLAVVGAPQTGKSTLLRSLLSAFFVTHTPAEAQFYCVDYGGGGLQALEGAPHVSGVADRLDGDRVRRVVREVEAVLAGRERRMPAGAAHVFLVIDNWPAFRQAAEDLEATVVDIAARGLGYGVHVVVTANRWTEIRSNLGDSLGGRLELRLNDPVESAVDRRAAANLPPGVPGRGLTPDGVQFQTALPRLDGLPSTGDLETALGELVGRVGTAWPGPAAPAVRVLPPVVGPADLTATGDDRQPGVPIGIAEADLQPAYLDLVGGDPHCVVYGDGESGKTTFLRAYLRGLAARYGPDQASVLLVDYRRTLLDAVGDGHLWGYAGAGPATAGEVARLRDVLTARLPAADLPAVRLRERSWWSGPELFVVVDDYDLVVTPPVNPLAPLLEFLALGRDVGLHLILARRVAGASRALFEPLLQRVRELAGPGLILSGDPHEGPLVGPHRATPQPPGRGLLVRRRQPPSLVQVVQVPS